MSVSNYNICKYHIPKLKPIIYLLDSTKLENKIHIDDEYALIDGIENGDVLKINGFNTELTETDSIDERYRFEKQVTFSLNGYYSLTNIHNRFYIVVEDNEGRQWMCNVDLPSKASYNYTIDEQNNNTTYTFQILSNFPLIRLKNNISGEEIRHCRYFVGGIKAIQMLEKGSAMINTETKEVTTFGNSTWKDIVPLTKSFTETFDGDNFNTSLNFSIPLDEYKSHFYYTLLEFTQNRYVAIVEPINGENTTYIGFDDFGLAPSYSISTEGTNIVNISLNGVSRSVFDEPYDITEDGELYWVGVSSVTTDRGEYMTSYECSSTNGYAKYLLLKEINQFGEPTGNYKVLEGYEEDYANFINIVGTFDNEILFPNNDCIFHCSTISTIPNLIVFSAVTSYSYTVNSLCNWNVTHNLPNGVVISPLTGEAGITNVTISCNDISANEGLYTLVLHTADEDLTTTVSVRLSQNESYYKEIDARRQNVYFTTAFNLIDLQSGDIDKISAYEIENNIIKIVIPRNDTTESRVFELHGINMYGSLVDFYIEQYGIIQEWIEEDDEYVCVSGNLYTVATLWTGYTANTLRRTNETRAETLSVPSSDECEQYYRWQYNGDTVCVSGDLYQLLVEMQSADGYEWRETENTMQGDLIEKYSLECAENVYSISAYTTDEVGSSIWTTMIVNINGNTTRYSDVSAITFSVAEGCPFVIEFADKENYFRPPSIMATATTDTAYTGVYTSSRGINIGVKTIDENRNYIITDIEVCVNNRCRTYQSTSAVTFNTRPNDNFEINFGNVSGYDTPPSITSVSTADVDYFAIYEFESIQYNITVNIEDDNDNPLLTDITICIDGTCNTYQNVSAYTFNVPQGLDYSISFGGVQGYDTPNYISGTATANTSYTAVYQEIVPATYKARLTLTGGTTVDIPLNGDSRLLQNEISPYSATNISCVITTAVTAIGGIYDGGTFLHNENLTSVTIPNTVSIIGTQAFIGCYILPSIYIPSSVTSIGGMAFADCSGLTSIIVSNDNTVYDSRNNCNAIIETSTNTLIVGCKNTVIPNNITTIGQYAFYGSGGLTNITIPNSVTSIGRNAFTNCYGLTSVTIPDSVTSIGQSVFYGCSSLTSITIPNSVTSIERSVFLGCANLTSITIGSGVTSIGYRAFWNCTSLNSLTSLATTAPTLQNGAFNGIAPDGTLYYPNGSDYSAWISELNTESYGWTAIPI